MQGLAFFLRHPSLWWRPLLATTVVWAVVITGAVYATIWQWPGSGSGWWSYTWHLFAALGIGLSVALVGWLIVVPIALSFVYEQLARHCHRLSGAAESSEEPIHRSLVSTARVVIATLPLRLGWLVLSLTGSIVGGPVGIVVGALALGHVGAIDAVDIALAVRGVPGAERLRALRENKGMIRGGMLYAAALSFALGITVVGWILWMPAMVCGAALATLGWNDPEKIRA